MNSSQRLRMITRPPPGKPSWVPTGSADFDLLYLGWGQRKYGDWPIPANWHEGWTYHLVLKGAPRLILNGCEVALRPGVFSLIGPDCACGAVDQPGALSEVVSWIWRDIPFFLRSEKNVLQVQKHCLLDAVGCRFLKKLLHRCREEVHAPDRFTRELLDGFRKELDVYLARAFFPGKRSSSGGQWRLHLALQWIATQRGVKDPARALCDYLQISSSTLNRLFLQHLQCSPRSYLHRMRMEQAMDLKERMPLKEVAWHLGYRYPNDLSRALSRYLKINRKQVRIFPPMSGRKH